ncbi:MAG TPA: flavodoxin [Firmicutes bacterium]|nr:flavodoxin [Bacillota bacterium]
MKALIVFYSLDGNSKFIAETVASVINADILEIKPVNDFKNKSYLGKIMAGGKQVLFKMHPDLKPLDKNPGDYDFLIIGTPVWAGTYASPFNTFFDKFKITGKEIALYWCHQGGPGKIFEKFKQVLAGNKIVGYIDFFNPIKRDLEENRKRALEWGRYLGTEYLKKEK